MASIGTPIKTGTLVRSAQLDRAGLNKEKRTITVRFSTETPVKRWFGSETLSHDSNAVRLDRMKNGAAVLLEHDCDQRVGITESASITAEKNGEAVVRFARTPLGDQCMNEVEDGTLRWVSVGYVVNRFEVNEDEDEYRAIDWEPLEVSFVGIPADTNARVLRSQEHTHESIVMKRTLLLDALNVNGGGAAITAPNVVTKEDFSRELDEAREIFTLGAQYQRTHPEVTPLVEKALKDKMPIRDFQRQLIAITSKPSLERTEIVASKQEVRGARSVGGRFVESAQYKEAAKRKIGKGNHINLELPDMYAFRADHEGMQTRVNFGIGTSDVSGSTDLGGTSGAGIDIQRQWNPLNQQPLAIADLFSQGTTGGDIVRYIRELTFTNAAGRVAEASAKPQAQLDVGVINATVEKTAVYLDVTEEMMNDWQQAASFINSRLAYMVQAKEDAFLLNGTGSSEITGIFNTSGIQTVSGATNTIDQFLRAKAYVEGANGAGFSAPDAFVMNPIDWLNARLTKDGNGQYLFGGPSTGAYGVGGYSNVGAMWGLPVVTSTFCTQGSALVGAFRMGAQIFRRAGVTIRTTDSDGSKFLSNILTVLAESRFALAVYQPNKFCSITGIPA